MTETNKTKQKKKTTATEKIDMLEFQAAKAFL